MSQRGRGEGPVRTCVGCRRARPAIELTRLVLVDGTVVADPKHRRPGRGAYVCADPDCMRRAAGRIAKALRAQIGPDATKWLMDGETERLSRD